MKEISTKCSVYGHTIIQMDLCDAFSETPSTTGLYICYALATYGQHPDHNGIELKAETEELGVPSEWYYSFNGKSFSETYDSFETFLSLYDCDNFGSWHVELCYQDAIIRFSGQKDTCRVGISFASELNVDVLPLIRDIESATYSFSRYDKDVMELLKAKYKMSEKRAVLTVQKLLKHRDIYAEFVQTSSMSGEVKEDGMVSVAGFTAQKLHREYPLSLLGAYNYLIYLREEPEAALTALKNGLPRK